LSKSLRSIGLAAVLIGASVGYGWAAGDVAKGALFVKSRCGQCHTVERGGPNKIGPNLFGVFGRRAAAAAGYSFSGAMQKSGIVWTADKLAAYLKNPRATVPGTKMTYAGIVRDEDNANTVAYLATLK
jgi:cytochrome c